MMRMVALLAGVLMAAGCDTASPEFRGLPATRVTVAGSVFDVRVRGKFAEAIRINPQYAPRFGPIRERASQAMASASGCRVKKVTGDQAVARGILDCGDGGPVVWSEPIELDCVPIRGSEIKQIDGYRVEIDCN